jgi:hypothetical protein
MLVMAGNGDAQEAPPVRAAGDPNAQISDEVIVRGKRTLLDLRTELQAARERVWGVFNAINSNNDFDISCMDAARTGSRIPQRAGVSPKLH